MWYYFKNSRGNPDFLLTVSALTVGAVLLKFILGGVTIASKFDFGPIPDGGVIAALLGPTLAAYTAKRIKVDDP